MTDLTPTKIEVLLPEDDFETPEDVEGKAAAYRRTAQAKWPDASISVEVAPRQSGGGYTHVLDADGDPLDDWADWLDSMTENEWA